MGRTLYEQAISREALDAAWREVMANDSQDGQLQPAIQRYAEDAEQRLEGLADRLAHEGAYQPADLREIRLPKPDGGTRLLHVPTVQDRIVERAILRVVTPLIDPLLGSGAYGYRQGIGVPDALQEVVSLRDEGHPFAVRTDIHDCFPSIDIENLLRALAVCLSGEDALLGLIRRLLARCSVSERGRGTFPGLPQGGPLSPLFSNLVLRPLDEALIRHGFPVVRYADDVVIACRSESAAREALSLARTTVEGLGMELGEDKTEIMSFEQGFCFLGEDFGPRYPPALTDHRVRDPEARILYVGRQGSRVRLARGRVIVQSADDAELLSVPMTEVKRVVCFGSVGVSAGLRDWAMTTQVEVTFASRRGSYQGQLTGTHAKKRVQRLRAQLALEESRRHRLAAVCVEGKLRKQGVLLERFTREENSAAVSPRVAEIDYVAAMIPEAVTIQELMGLEGAGAKAFFLGMEALLPPELGFTGRNRQPPLDVVNAALSFGYTLLLGECVTAIVAAGLDPAIGCLHSDADNKPALALDLCEEFRPWVVDQVVVESFRRGLLTGAHGTSEKGKPGVLLTKAGRESLIAAYERRMLRTTKGAMPDFAGTIRRHLYRQAQRLSAAITGDPTAFQALSWR